MSKYSLTKRKKRIPAPVLLLIYILGMLAGAVILEWWRN